MSRVQPLLTAFSQPRSALITGGIVVSIKALIDIASYGIVGGFLVGLTTLALFGWTGMGLLITLNQLLSAGWLRLCTIAFLIYVTVLTILVATPFNDLYAEWHFYRYRMHHERIIRHITTGQNVPEDTYPYEYIRIIATEPNTLVLFPMQGQGWNYTALFYRADTSELPQCAESAVLSWRQFDQYWFWIECGE